MEWLTHFIQAFIKLDDTLGGFIHDYGAWTYGLLFLIVFLETGLVVTPFLPGDSLLFTAGAFAALRKDNPAHLEMSWVLLLLSAAAVLGDTVNYHIGWYLGPKVFKREKSWFFRREYLDRTHAFYERYGGKTIIIARFVPVIRTFAPFVAGIGKMSYLRFLSYNVVGGVFWVVSLSYVGYFFGNIAWVKAHFGAVIIGIIVVSCLPAVIEYLRERKRPSPAAPPPTTP